MCGKLVGPVCGWLHVIAGVLKRHVIVVTKGWDDLVDGASLKRVVKKVLARVTHDDPIKVTGEYPEKSRMCGLMRARW